MKKIYKFMNMLIIATVMLNSVSINTNALSNTKDNNLWFENSEEYSNFTKDKFYEESFVKQFYIKVEENISKKENKNVELTLVTEEEFKEQSNKINEYNKQMSLGNKMIHPFSDEWNSQKVTSYMNWNVFVNKWGDSYDISASYYWTKVTSDPRPYFVGNDIFTISFGSNLGLIPDSAGFVWENDHWLNGNMITNSGFYDVITDLGGIGVDTKLGSRLHMGINYYGANERGILFCTTTKKSNSAIGENIFTNYFLQQKGTITSVGISIPAGGSVSISNETNFERLRDNPQLFIAMS